MSSPPLFLPLIICLFVTFRGTNLSDPSDLLLPVLEDLSAPWEAVAAAALALGQIHVGTADGQVTEVLVSAALIRDMNAGEAHARSLLLAIGLVYLNRQNAAEVCDRVLG